MFSGPTTDGYVATLLVMIFAFRWVRVPAYLGKNYDRESRLTG